MVVIGAGYASAFLPGGVPRAATFAFAIATAAIMTAILLLGAINKRRRLGILAWILPFIFVVLAGGFCFALLQTEVDTKRLWLGLPAGAAAIIYIVGFIPMIILPIAYALTFDEDRPE